MCIRDSVGIMLYYAYTVNKDKSDSLSIEQKADSVYYMGFILTLVAMTASLVALAYDDELRFNAVVINFGLALATTILGLAIRIIWIQLSSKSLSDAESILKERIIRRSQDLQDQTEKVVGSMTALSNQLSKVAEPLQNNFERLTKTMDINVIVENHGGLSSDASLLAQVMKKTNLDNCGTLPDFGNFCISNDWGADLRCKVEYDKYKGVAELMPYAKSVSAKSYNFDENGNETKIDYVRMMKIVKDHDYQGFIGVEYEGNVLNEKDGILATKNLIERLL